MDTMFASVVTGAVESSAGQMHRQAQAQERTNQRQRIKEARDAKRQARKDFIALMKDHSKSKKASAKYTVSPDVVVERHLLKLRFQGPSGKREIDLLEWYPPDSREAFVENEVGMTSEKTGNLLKLSKELGYFGFTAIGERFQERRLKLKDGFLSYEIPGSNNPIYSIPLQDAWVEFQPKGEARRKDAFDMNSRGGYLSSDDSEFMGNISRTCILVHKPEDVSKTTPGYTPYTRQSWLSYTYRYVTGSNKGPGNLSNHARSFYFSSDDEVELKAWFDAIKAQIEYVAALNHPIAVAKRLIVEVGGSLEGLDMENLLDQVYGYI